VGQLAVRYFDVKQDEDAINGSITPSYSKAQNAAFQYVTSIFDGASPSLTVQDILSATLGVAASGISGKKKQGNKSKKRQERRLKNASIFVDDDNGDSHTGSDCLAEEELSRRKNAACLASAFIFGVSIHGDCPTRDTTLKLSSSSMFTHGVCSTISTAAASVLPRLLWLERNANESNGTSERWWMNSFDAVLTSLRRICQSPNRDIRALSYEPLMFLHESLNSTPVVRFSMEQTAVDAICDVSRAFSKVYIDTCPSLG
jgi:hypothetical protein